MSKTTKLLVMAGVILYMVSPIDLAPGPIDDVIVLLASVIVSQKANKKVIV